MAAAADALREFGRCATREVAAVLGVTDDDAEILLEELEVAEGTRLEAFGPAALWRSAGMR